MPKAAPRNSTASAAPSRKKPYDRPTTAKPTTNDDKENVNPSGKKTEGQSRGKSSSKPCDDPAFDWRTISLEKIYDEVPMHEPASMVRRKLQKLVSDKDEIPHPIGSHKKWSKASISHEMQTLEQIDGSVEGSRIYGNNGAISQKALDTFLKKKGHMGGANSGCYYWGYVLLEKLRIYNGQKKSKARLADEEK